MPEPCTPAQISLGKLNNVREAIAIAREARTILGGDGVLLENSPIRHAANLESVRTYEGTDEVHTLILGQHLTGIARVPLTTRAGHADSAGHPASGRWKVVRLRPSAREVRDDVHTPSCCREMPGSRSSPKEVG